MKRVAILQARMTSTRFPGKVLADLEGRPLLAHVIRRVRKIDGVNEVVVATTDQPTDDPVVAMVEKEGGRWFRGDESDVLGRYAGAAKEAAADVIVRVTADCPLLDPEVSGRVLQALAAGVDYAANTLSRSFPRGLDTEAFTREALDRMQREAVSVVAREHVTWYLHREHPERFVIRSVVDSDDNSDLRWTVDTEEDLSLVRTLYAILGLGDKIRPYREVLAYVRAHPRLAMLNRHIPQKDA